MVWCRKYRHRLFFAFVLEKSVSVCYHERTVKHPLEPLERGTLWPFLAYLFAILKNVIYGTTVFFTGNLTETVDVLDLLALRFLLSFVIFWLCKATRIVKIKISVKDFFVK